MTFLVVSEKTLDPEGFGFIDCPELFDAYGRDTWLHFAQLQHFQPGDSVEFTMTLNKDGHPQAIDLGQQTYAGQMAATSFSPRPFGAGHGKGPSRSGEEGQRYRGIPGGTPGIVFFSELVYTHINFQTQYANKLGGCLNLKLHLVSFCLRLVFMERRACCHLFVSIWFIMLRHDCAAV